MKKINKLLEGVTKALSSVKVGGVKDDPALVDLDRGILAVALMVAGLDGTILPAEYAAFLSLAKTCRGASASFVRACLDAAAPLAGRLVVMAQTSAYDEKARLAVFVQTAQKVLPKRFSCGSLADLRRAFALWTAMAVADGTFSELERKALAALAAWCATVKTKKHEVSLLEPEFFDKAERIVRRLNSDARRAEAEMAFQEFVGTVEIPVTGGTARHAAASIALGFAAACLAVG